MKRATYIFPNTAQRLPKRPGTSQVEEDFTREYLESLTVADLNDMLVEEIKGSGARGRVLKRDLVESLLR